MNLSHLFQSPFFKSFFTVLRGTSWPIGSSISCEAVLKAKKKSLKNHYFE
jgi:hypothetical protein